MRRILGSVLDADRAVMGRVEVRRRPERDLDQLSLIPGPSVMRAVEVPSERAVFLKMPSDFEDPDKLAFFNT